MPQNPDSQMGSFITMSMLVLVSVINIWDCSAKTCASNSEGCGKCWGEKIKENYLPVKSNCKSSSLVWHLLRAAGDSESHCRGKSRCNDLVPLISCPASFLVIFLHGHRTPTTAVGICVSPCWNKRDMSGWAECIQALRRIWAYMAGSSIFLWSRQPRRLLPWKPKSEMWWFQSKALTWRDER